MSFSDFPAATPSLPAPYPAQTQQDLLDVLDAVLPDHYLAPLKDPGPGYEVPQAHAAMLAFASLMVEYLASGAFILSASGPAKAEATVQFYRESAAAGAVTVKRGTVVSAPASGREYITQHDAVFGADDLGPVQVPVQARFYGWAYNVKGPVTLPSGEVLEGEISHVRLPLQDPVYADPSIRVAQVTDAVGGTLGMLDALGKDRGIQRQPGEGDAQYRGRIRALPDTVSLDAIERAIERVLRCYGVSATVIETWQAEYQTCYDAPNKTYPYLGAGYDPNLFCYDDPRSTPLFRNRWLDEVDRRGGFIVTVPNLAAIRDTGFVYDDAAATPEAHRTANGVRGVGVYDLPAEGTHPDLVPSGYDGIDLPKRAVYKGLYDLLQSVKAGGVAATVELEGE